MTSDSATVSDLRAKRSELKERQEDIRQELKMIDDRLEAINKTIDLFTTEGSNGGGSGKQLPDWPEGQSMPKRVVHVLKQVGRIMQSNEVDEYVRANSSADIRDNAVAETLSRLARQDKISRKDYGENTYHYGLKQWWSEEEGDFIDSAMPDQWALPNS